MRLSSSSLPQLTAHFSDSTRLVLCSGPPPEPRRAVGALLKTCNQLITFCGVPSVPCISVHFYRWVARVGREGRLGRGGHLLHHTVSLSSDGSATACLS